jgi:hypothetical protein
MSRPAVHALLIALLVGGCGGAADAPAGRPGGEAPAPHQDRAAGPAGSGGYAVEPPASPGRVVGSVLFTGASPDLAPVAVTKDQAACGLTRHVPETLVVGAGGALRNAVVSIDGIARGKAFPPGGRPTLDQRGCWFIPHLQVVPAGAEIDILNSDGILHNIHTFPKNNPPINMAQPRFRKILNHAFARPDVVKVTCDVHSWMNAWIVVTAHPYFAVTAADGTFSITDVPPGMYTLRAWHETLGSREQTIAVAPGGTTEASFRFGG